MTKQRIDAIRSTEVIGSTDPEKFQEGMGVELLANLAEVLSLIIKPWIAEK